MFSQNQLRLLPSELSRPQLRTQLYQYLTRLDIIADSYQHPHALKCRVRPPEVENRRSQLGHFRAVDMTRSSFDIILKMGWCPVEYVIAVLACHVVISNYIVLLK
jgi:hypothetical protein